MTSEQQKLLKQAQQAALLAYAPYSNFRVGAAVLTPGGIFTGANIENACTNLGICAERVALSHARMNGETRIIGIAVACIDAEQNQDGTIDLYRIMPCGACRQWLAELAPDAWLITPASDTVFTLSDLLPHAFVLSGSAKENP